jgi:hypothetical protein
MKRTDGPGIRSNAAVAAANTSRVAGSGMETILRERLGRHIRERPEPDP